MALFSMKAYAQIASLLNIIEGGAQWPRGTAKGKAVYMQKDESKPDDPMAQRVLMMLPALYRRWAGCRLTAMRDWVAKWALQNIYAGALPLGAEDAWYVLMLKLEDLDRRKEDYAGAMIDISRFFDQVNRQLVYKIARLAGMPTGILGAYARFQESVKVYNEIGKGLGIPYTRRCGIPQGDPLSMLAAALLLRPWVEAVQRCGVQASVLVDDIMVVAQGDDLVSDLVRSVNFTHDYLHDMGAIVAPSKSINSSSNGIARKWLAEYLWTRIGNAKIDVQRDLRYLGAQINTTKKKAKATARKRIEKATYIARKLAKMPIPIPKQMHILDAKLNNLALYATEANMPNEGDLKKYAVAVADCIVGKGRKRDIADTIALQAAHYKVVDPVAAMHSKVFATFRRIFVKHPEEREKKLTEF